MPRPVTLFTGQWADLTLETMCQKAAAFGYDGLELACWGDHFEVQKADEAYCRGRWELLGRHGLKCFAISNHLVGQAVCGVADGWGVGEEGGVGQRGGEEMKATARAAARLGVKVVIGFTGSGIWHLWYSFPPVSEGMVKAGFDDFAKRWGPILDV